MADPVNPSIAYLRTEPAAVLAPPSYAVGPQAWVRKNLLGDAKSTILTLVGIAILALVLPGAVRFLFIDAIWSAPDGTLCRAPGAGACWPFIWRKLAYFTYSSYPLDERWRVNLTMAMGGILIAWLLWYDAPKKTIAAGLFFIVYPIVSFWLLYGFPAIGLARVDTNYWGGIFVTLLLALVGIVFSLPLGVLLALGRRSDLPVVKFFSVVFIEFVRGVPFITVLFMANTMLPLFVPDNWNPDRLLRPLIGTVLFAAAYMAEVVRGGLQAIPKGQYEGAMAMGLGYWQMMRLVVMPQALTLVIPGIVNTFIGLFKDTSLVSIVGIFDFLNTINAARLDPDWAGPTITSTGYAFAALFYFVFCYGMARYSLMMERRLSAGRKH